MHTCKGPFKSLYLQLFSLKAMHKGDTTYNFDAGDWHVVYRDPPTSLTAIQDAVMALCKYDVTHELFGLGYLDLMQLDYPTFNRLKKEIIEICTQKAKAAAKLEKPLHELRRKDSGNT